MLGLVHLSTHAMADRYTYLPSIGLDIALVFAVARLGARSPGWRAGLARLAGFGNCRAGGLRRLGRRRSGATTRPCGGTPWPATRRTGKPNSDWASPCSGKAGGRKRSNITAWPTEHAIDSSPLINLGILLAQEGKLDEAIADFRQALKLDSVSNLAVQAHAQLGEALIEKNELAEAEQHLRRALAMDPQTIVAARGLARLELDRIVAREPNNAVAQNDLGTILFDQGKSAAAIEQFEKALAIESRVRPSPHPSGDRFGPRRTNR